jgi:short-subunit dehydrogenase
MLQSSSFSQGAIDESNLPGNRRDYRADERITMLVNNAGTGATATCLIHASRRSIR